MSERKYAAGESFADVHELIDWMDAGGWVWWRTKPVHPSIIQHLQLTTICQLVAGNPHNGLPWLRRAVAREVVHS